MQNKLLAIAGVGLLSVLITLPVMAKAVDGDRQAQRDERHAEMLERFDADGNGQLSQEERQSFRKEPIAKKLESMSPEERDNFQARLEEKKEMREQMKGMAKEERKAFREKRIAEKMENMPPEKQEKFKAHMEERKKMREQMKGLSKEDKKAFRKEHLADKLESMSPEEKKKFQARAEKRRIMRMSLRQGRSDSFSE